MPYTRFDNNSLVVLGRHSDSHEWLYEFGPGLSAGSAVFRFTAVERRLTARIALA
jgi:hypothetical protein